MEGKVPLEALEPIVSGCSLLMMLEKAGCRMSNDLIGLLCMFILAPEATNTDKLSDALAILVANLAGYAYTFPQASLYTRVLAGYIIQALSNDDSLLRESLEFLRSLASREPGDTGSKLIRRYVETYTRCLDNKLEPRTCLKESIASLVKLWFYTY